MLGSLGERDFPRALCFEELESRLALATDSLAQAVATDDAFELADRVSLQRVRDEFGLSGTGQTVVVIDSGIAYDHLALGGGLGAGYQVVGGWDFTEENDADPYDDGPSGSHGTHVAGILASRDLQQPGVAPGVDLVALRVFNDQGRSEFRWIEQALQWVIDHQHGFANPITTINLSIGMDPDDDLAPSERILEDEFAELVSRGIFISVAAGNGYDQDPQPGLSYPGESPWIVPVGSASASGQLSEFTRRDPRMLVAPGELILSTAPDHLEDFNHQTDDWYRFSGTSQATPYVAGAAVLVREALERAGREGIDQQMIYDVLRDTADWIPDAVTGQTYARVDVEAAVASILPTPNPRPIAPSSSAAFASAVDLGAVDYRRVDAPRLAGNERWYRFSTTHSGNVTVEAQFVTDAKMELEVYRPDGQALVRSLLAGGYERVDLPAKAGQTMLVRLSGAPTAGQLTIANLIDVHADSMSVRIPNSVDDVVVQLGAAPQILLDGLELSVGPLLGRDLQLDLNNTTRLRIRGAQGVETFYVRPGSVEAVGPGYGVHVRGGATFVLEAQGGTGDQLRIYGTMADERFVSRDGKDRWESSGVIVQAIGFDRTFVFAGGGKDRADLYGTSQDDLFVAHAEWARLTSAGQLDWVEGFTQVFAFANPAGLDRAFLYGSPENDSLEARASSTRLAAGNHLLRAESFDRVYATAGTGGLDRAYLYGSSEADEFRATPQEATRFGANFLQVAAAFDRVYAYGEVGDAAFLRGSSGDDLLIGRLDETVLGSEGFHISVCGFDRVYAEGGPGGDDRIRWLAPEQQDNRLYLGVDWATLASASYQWRASGFERIAALAGDGGENRAFLAETKLAVDSRRLDRLATDYQLESLGFSFPRDAPRNA